MTPKRNSISGNKATGTGGFFPPELGRSIKEEELESLVYPVLVQRKFDGYRCIVVNGKAYTREGNLIPNYSVQRLLKNTLPKNRPMTYYDGELVIADRNGVEKFENCGIFRDYTASISLGDNLQAYYVIFAIASGSTKIIPGSKSRLSAPADSSIIIPKGITNFHDDLKVRYAHTRVCNDSAEVIELLTSNKDWEGVMIRRPGDKYWFGKRAGKTNPFLLKLKQPLESMWGCIVDWEPQKSREKKKMVGSLVVALDDGNKVKVGTGLNYNQRIGLMTDFKNYRIRVGWERHTKYGNKKFPRVLELKRMAA